MGQKRWPKVCGQLSHSHMWFFQQRFTDPRPQPNWRRLGYTETTELLLPQTPVEMWWRAHLHRVVVWGRKAHPHGHDTENPRIQFKGEIQFLKRRSSCFQIAFSFSFFVKLNWHESTCTVWTWPLGWRWGLKKQHRSRHIDFIYVTQSARGLVYFENWLKPVLFFTAGRRGGGGVFAWSRKKTARPVSSPSVRTCRWRSLFVCSAKSFVIESHHIWALLNCFLLQATC